MSDLEVKIVRLEALRVICFNGYGEGPEQLAMDKLFSWAKAHGKSGRVFGYNNPNPTPGTPNYGYDAWMVIDQAVQPEGEARIIDFPGGLYAVTRCVISDPGQQIPETWQKLVRWRENSRYQAATHQWLEEQIQPQDAPAAANFVLDLYLPVRE